MRSGAPIVQDEDGIKSRGMPAMMKILVPFTNIKSEYRRNVMAAMGTGGSQSWTHGWLWASIDLGSIPAMALFSCTVTSRGLCDVRSTFPKWPTCCDDAVREMERVDQSTPGGSIRLAFATPTEAHVWHGSLLAARCSEVTAVLTSGCLF